MPSNSYFSVLSGIACALLSISSSAHAQEQMSPEWKACVSGAPPDRIRGCTKLMQPGLNRDALSDLLQRRGIAYLESGDRTRAFQDFDEAIRIKPDDESFATRGRAYRLEHDLHRAINDLDHAVRINAGNSFALSQRARAYRELGDGAKAARDFDESLRLNPLDNYTRYNRATFRAERGETAFALQDFDAIIKRMNELLLKRPNAPLFLFLRGLAKQGKGDAAGGAADIAAAKAGEPNVADNFWRLGR
ncbi:MAG TPA: tetratricopeptide repeat protein [Reyranella sp.]|jgi:tetratricopeptide (TPR) repeat protein|nr:tetratricopeptide repeat protein [Reyranella sp.]